MVMMHALHGCRRLSKDSLKSFQVISSILLRRMKLGFLQIEGSKVQYCNICRHSPMIWSFALRTIRAEVGNGRVSIIHLPIRSRREEGGCFWFPSLPCSPPPISTCYSFSPLFSFFSCMQQSISSINVAFFSCSFFLSSLIMIILQPFRLVHYSGIRKKQYRVDRN